MIIIRLMAIISDDIHVVDLVVYVVAIKRSLEKLLDYEIFNLGTGRGVSVLEIVTSF